MKVTVRTLPKKNGVPVKINVILLRFPQANLFLAKNNRVEFHRCVFRRDRAPRSCYFTSDKAEASVTESYHCRNHKYSFVTKIHHYLRCTSWLQNPTCLVRELSFILFIHPLCDIFG